MQPAPHDHRLEIAELRRRIEERASGPVRTGEADGGGERVFDQRETDIVTGTL